MSSITLSFDDHSRQAVGTPVFVEVLDEKLERVQGQERIVDVDAQSVFSDLTTGLYLIRAEMPNGERLSATVSLDGNDAKAKIQLESEDRSPRESLSWAYTGQGVRKVSQESAQSAARRNSEALFGLSDDEASRARPRVELLGLYRAVPTPAGRPRFTLQKGVISSEDLSVSAADARLVTQFSLAQPNFRLGDPGDWFPLCVHYAVRGGESAPAQEKIVMVPPAGELKLLFLRTPGENLAAPDASDFALESGAEMGVRALVKGGDPRAEALLSFVRQGAIATARRVYRDNAGYAFNLLQGKNGNPVGAIIGGYFLLQAGDLDRQDWMLNLSNWFEELPDGAIIYAASQLRGPGATARDEARTHLLRAVARGLPIYTSGLRLLFDGLRRLVDENQSQGKNLDSDPALRDALAQVRFIAAYADWDSTTTAFSLPEERKSWPVQWSDFG